jgi:hypothetical protein
MPNPDDKQDVDVDAGKTDAASFSRRFQRVADIVHRANNRFDKVTVDPGPINDPAVITALQAIQTETAALNAKVAALLAGGSPAVP